MRKATLILLGCLWMFTINAQDLAEVRTESNIEEVMVYKNNARILRKAKTNVPAGKSEIILENLSKKILLNSIQVKLGNKNVSLISAVPRINYFKATAISKEHKMISDSIKLLDENYKILLVDKGVIQATKNVLLNNNPLTSNKETGFDINAVKELMEFRRKELSSIERALLDLRNQEEQIKLDRRRLQLQLNTLSNTMSQSSGELVLQVDAVAKTSTNIEVKYVVTNAGWTPIYDLKSDGVGSPLELVHKAQVYQSTGTDWDQVKLSLSSSDPSLSHDRPILSPLNLALSQTYNYKPKAKSKGNTYIQYQGSGDIVLEDKEQNILRNSPERGIASVAVTTAGVNQADQGEAINSNGSRSTSNDTYIDGVRVIGNFGIPETEIRDVRMLEFNPDDILGLNDHTIDFELELLQSIPSDRKEHIIEIRTDEIEVNYEYHIVPKLDKGAFLLAKITDYGKYNLMSAKANIFFEDVYLGQSFINSKVTTDTLLLSLGRDEKISVLREKVKSERKEGVSLVRETIGFDLKIRNNKTETIEITVLDQIPVSKNKDLEVRLISSSSARYYTPYGSLRWQKKVAPNKTEKLSFEYEVRFPKNRGIVKVR